MGVAMHRDVIRTVFFLVLVAALYLVDRTNWVVIQALGIGILLAAGSHLTRRILMPQVDLHLIAKKAGETPSGAAAVFVGVVFFIVAVMYLSMSMLR